ncbi:DNA_polymerase [Hexamita inflata]|uniref:DNA-directed DNA polymerase n=1 Tax=Hexamita inflata TaxID=28002 RepID=A0AA86QG40_9EUKA|nr:DNA polymerase [Hexamita inflata]
MSINIKNFTIPELKVLLQDFDFDEKSMKTIKNKIKKLKILEEMQRIMPDFEAMKQQEISQKKKLSILEEMQRIIPDFEAMKQQENDYKQKIQNKNIQLEEQIKSYSKEDINNYLDRQQQDNKGIIRFDGDYNRIMIKYHLDDIMRFHKGKFIRIYYRDDEDKTTIFVYPIKNRLIQNISNAIFKGVNLEETHAGSDQQLEFKLLKAYKIEILVAENVFNQNLLENEKKLDDIDKYIKEKQKKQLVKSIDLKTNKKNKGAYFNFINKIPQINLQRYQIGNNLQQHLELSRRAQCFIYALQISGQYTNQEIQVILIQVQSNLQLFSLSQIKNIKHIGPMCIHVYQESNRQVRIYKIKGDTDDLRQQQKDVVRIGLYREHYFIYDTNVEVSNFWLNNFQKYKTYQKYLDNTNIVQVRETSNNICVTTGKSQNDSITVIRMMHELNMFEEIKDYNEFNYKENSKQVISAPDNAQDYCSETKEFIEKENHFDKILYADTEAFTIDSEGKYIKHKCYLCVWADGDIIKSSRDVNGLVRYIDKCYIDEKHDAKKNNFPDKQILIYMHNLSYDCQFILKEQYQIEDMIQNNGKVLQFSFSIYNRQGLKIQFVFRDSYIMISKKLSELPEMFLSVEEQKTIQKEIMCYNYYTEERYVNNIGNIEEASKFISNHTKQEFISVLKKSDCMIDDNCFDMQKYALFYCKQDVIVLQKCVQKFAQLLKENMDMNLFNYISISSLALSYQLKKQCFNKVYKVNGLLRQFLQQFVIGGRCMTAYNKKQILLFKKILDFDAVSLYPSAQYRTYYPAGKLYTLTPELIQHYNVKENLFQITEKSSSKDQNTLYLEVKLFKGNDFIVRGFPLLSQKVDGVRQFTNDIDKENRYFVDTIGLQELVLRQNYKYEIISGVYAKERDYTIQGVIKYMFEERVKCKKQKNPLQEIYKLMLNSSYGKTIEGDRNETVEIYEDLSQLFKKYDQINSIQQYGNKFCVKLEKECCEQTGYHHVGIQILSMSKRIMNEVMVLADDLGLNIYYQDTDSMQIQKNDLKILSKQFKKQYNRQLIGEQMGQFHSDFKSKSGKVAYGRDGIYISIKVYCVKLRVEKIVKKDDENEVKNEVKKDDKKQVKQFCYDYHIRMKGITSECITQKADKLYKGDVIKLYEDLAKGVPIEFDLCSAKVFMKKQDDYSYMNLSEFKRTLQF